MSRLIPLAAAIFVVDVVNNDITLDRACYSLATVSIGLLIAIAIVWAIEHFVDGT